MMPVHPGLSPNHGAPDGAPIQDLLTRGRTMLTDRQIQAAIKTAAAEVTLNDKADGKGTGSLRLRIRPTRNGATATWLAFWKHGGQRAFMPLGRYPELSLKDAREKFATEVRPALAAGQDPRIKAVPAELPTVERLFQGYIASMRENGRSSADEVAAYVQRRRDLGKKAFIDGPHFELSRKEYPA